MRKKIVIANWKMNLNIQKGILLFEEIQKEVLLNNFNPIIILAVPHTHINSISEKLSSNIYISAQDCSIYENGAYTGDVSAEILYSVGAKYVILGHSERRKYYAENNLLLSKKVSIALKNNLKVIYCCGETISDRESNTYFEVIENQIKESLFHLNNDEIKNIIIAYEPVWAIGTGLTASSSEAQEVHLFIRNLIEKNFNKKIADELSILYGGSCNSKNSSELFSKNDIDGGLIGGASLNSNDFIKIINSIK
tara:strand:+ start:1781 stop:2536 length:756 start_codon:yes stop_codon:yes gene_type:complete